MQEAIAPSHSSRVRAQPAWRARLLLALLTLLLTPAAGAQMQRLQFDHLTTGFELDGQHRDLQCESCHANAIFKGTPKDCGACHGVGTAIRATSKPVNHILTTDQCGGCHTPIGWKPVVNFDHTLTRGSCSSCHNGVQAQGKGPTHIQTDLECDACHTTLTWAGAVFSHQGITSGCASCHNGVQATGMPATHIPTGTPATPCEGCHSTTNFLSFAGTAINHGAVTAMTCATCHETANYLGMHPSTNTAAGDSRPNRTLDANHPATGDCGMCHDTASFAGAAVKPPNHIPTSAPCVQCHTTPGQNSSYSVTGVHQGVTGCLACHGPSVANTFINISIVTTPANHMPIGSLDCNGSGCHSTANVNPGGFLIGTANINTPTLSVAGHATVAAAVAACQTCHETSPYIGMVASTAATAGDSRPIAFDSLHPTTGDCGGCHTTTPTFISNINAGKPANHIPTSAPCTQCHTTPNNYKVYSVTGTHQGVTGCLACHGPSVATTFANVTIVTTPANHIPFGGLDCNGSGCHTTSNLNPGGFLIGTANINAPTLSVAGHATVSGAVACATCHETAPYLGMVASTATVAGDSRPSATLDAQHPATGDCGGCHMTTPTFVGNAAVKPGNHIPTSAPCAQCHTTAGSYAAYSVTGTHVGVTGCLSCHGPSVATTFANVTIVTTPANHMPIGSLDCNGSGCHTTGNVSPGGFVIGAANINTPTLTVAGHTTVASAVSGCQTCHETAPYAGMLAGTATTAGDSRPTALDKAHPTTGDCTGCHTTTPTFGSDQTSGAKPSNHIPTSAACTQCHTTAGNYAAYSVTGTHTGVTGCLICHGPSVATTFANVTIVTTPANHMPIGSLDCNGSGCHTISNVNPGGFLIGAANINTPTLTVAGHTTVAAAVSGCQTCHETSPYVGMIASTSTVAGDSRPAAALDASHPTTGDCNGCHTTTPTFTSNETGAAKPANHIPTSAACTQCHTTAGNYAAYVMGATGHKGITNNCAQCHAYGLSFYNMAPPTLVEPPSGASGHIPAVPPNGTTAVACELCHSPTAFTTFSGTVMKHAYVTSMKCESCHEYGMTWKTNSGVRLWVRDGPNHHAGQDCGGSGCHTSRDKMMVRPRATAPTRPATPGSPAASATAAPAARPTTLPALRPGFPGIAADTPLGARPRPGATLPLALTAGTAHASLGGAPCVSCHGPASGSGKPPTHLATSDACQSCHTTLAWLPVTRVDHSQITRACVSCHNGAIATGKPSRHIATTVGCDSCHTTNAWTPARFDHAAVAPHGCTTCHNGLRAMGMPRAHVTTQLPCDTCHGTLAWAPAKIDHSRLTATCASCHNNIGALGMSSSHLRTQRDCASCHNYPDWSAVHFRHASAAYPGDHRTALACAACHTTGTEQATRAAPANLGSCAACHARDFNPAAHPRAVKGASYTVGELANCSGACHVYSDATQSVVTRSRPGPQHRVTDGAFRR